MKLSTKGLELLKSLEGYSDTPYKDTGGKLTIGYGHLIPVGALIPKFMPLWECEALLKQDVVMFEQGIAQYVSVPVEQHQFDALVIFSFNVGTAHFRSSTLRRLLNKRLYLPAADEFDKWIYVNKVPSKGLIRRRKIEKKLFLTGEYHGL